MYVTVRSLQAKMESVDLAKTVFTVRTDFFVFLYTVTKSGLSSNSRFRYQDNEDKLSRILESICNDLEPIF
jgi:hypothetical protein